MGRLRWASSALLSSHHYSACALSANAAGVRVGEMVSNTNRTKSMTRVIHFIERIFAGTHTFGSIQRDCHFVFDTKRIVVHLKTKCDKVPIQINNFEFDHSVHNH